jgi:DNA-binding transcriptional ArsR family regulator
VPDIIEVLAEPHRRRILDRLRGGETSVGALVHDLGSSQPLVSKHLRVLREAGLVDVRADGQRRLYRVRPEGLMELDAWLEPYRQMWRESLDRLEAHVTTSGDSSE